MKKKYRRITELTDLEIKELLEEVVGPVVKTRDIKRNKHDNTVSAYITTKWGKISFEMEDLIELTETEYSVDFSITPDDIWKYRQYLFALGVNPLTQDNPYIGKV